MTETTAFEEQLQALHAQADSRYHAGDLQGARQIWEAILQISPEDHRALEGVRLAVLASGQWSLMEESAPTSPDRAAQVAKIQECLGYGLAGEAVTLAENLLGQYPHDAELEALLQKGRMALQRSSLVKPGLEQAREAMAHGDAHATLSACREVLEIDPVNREASLMLEQLETLGTGETQAVSGPGTCPKVPVPPDGGAGPSSPADTVATPPPASGPSLELDLEAVGQVPAHSAAPPASTGPGGAGDLDLDLDLDLPATPSSPPAQPTAPQPHESDVSVRDLFEAAEDLDVRPEVEEYERPGGVVPIPEPDPQQGESAMLVVRARRALKEGDLSLATDLASRAMAIAEETPGAQEILDDARLETQRVAEQAENLLVEGTAELESGRAGAAVPLLEEALNLVPGHPEIESVLARAREAAAAPGAGGACSEEEDLAAMASIPLAGPRPEAGAEPHRLGPPIDGFDASAGVAVPPPASAVVPPPPPSGVAVPSPGGPPVSLDPVPTDSGPVPQRPSAEKAEPAKPAKKRLSRTASPALSPPLAAALLIVLLGAGGWYGYRYWRGKNSRAEAQDSFAEAISTPAPVETENVGPSAPADSGVKVSTTAASTKQERYQKRDVPRLSSRADRLLALGREAEAVALLEKAQQADPSSFEVMDRLEQARSALRQRRKAEERIAIGKEAFADGGYEEALRIFYRIPDPYKPKQLNRWLANGWYNLGVQAFQAGDPVEAARFFSDCLELRPSDAEAERHREVARRYRRRGLDDVFRIYVSRLEPRAMED